MQFLDTADLEFRRDQTEFLFALYRGYLDSDFPPDSLKETIVGLANRPACNLTFEQIEGLLERLGLQSA